jgi:hypothetical protein
VFYLPVNRLVRCAHSNYPITRAPAVVETKIPPSGAEPPDEYDHKQLKTVTSLSTWPEEEDLETKGSTVYIGENRPTGKGPAHGMCRVLRPILGIHM